MPLDDQLIDQLLEGCTTPEEILGESGLLKRLTQKIAERALEAEMDHHLGYPKHDPIGNNSGNSRNGKSSKTVRSEHGDLDLQVPRDRNSTFEPQLVKKGERQLGGFDERIVSLYAKGMSTRDIQSHFLEVYGVEVSATFISQVTQAVLEEVSAWQQRPLEALYPIVYLDALVVRSRAAGTVQNRAVYLALGINCDGEKALLGLWMEQHEGAKFWLSVLNELNNRGVQDIFIACVDGLHGFPEAIEAVYPHTRVQRCIVHQVRHSLRYVSLKQRPAVAADLKRVYTAPTIQAGEQALAAFGKKWDSQHPAISRAWQHNWSYLSTFYDYPPEIRKIIYTTNAIESLNASLRKVTKTRRSFPTDEAAIKVLYLAILQLSKKWHRPIANWKQAMSQFIIMYGERVPTS